MSKIFDIAIIGSGIAGAGLAAMIGDQATTLLLEAEATPGYHATGRSAAFWSETYGGPAIQPLTSASGPRLKAGGFLFPRGIAHVADQDGLDALKKFQESFAGTPVVLTPLDRAAIEATGARLKAGWDHGLSEASCEDIDVAALHAHFLSVAKKTGTELHTHNRVTALTRKEGYWFIETTRGSFKAARVVNAAGAWASEIAKLAGALPVVITPYRRTMIQLQVSPTPPAAMPIIIDALTRFYFKPEAGNRFWLSPHDEHPQPPADVAPEEMDVAIAIDRFQQAADWKIEKVERTWAGLRSFSPDRAPIYGADPKAEGFFWCAGQGGFGIQTSSAGSMLAACLLLEQALPDWLKDVDPERYSPKRFQV
ncbi:MAG: FAD-binding oxidoreductase [Zymomonas mobilis subsp. pomaceae]|uniref:FAD dependent oxidoreductase n=1 Tax=Zymomonas mobilis subsp. pomaceae (strain ATCC 29192 / DSM 22645 / JCM 10191 / CCUG 17912 / NBRC 13757 / NCIMB 11200 / NRRL B-4491 / Barker I) TaxID=579138 RepID=F8EWA7_ZYMMT|nr:FAD-binding oxidoreductase [Zymomonas mobilis]AEI38517.1 FAD dependent oxidoreductase [Zymomonas mobilis subsp. pomaceae ATCC 29192]MDX5948207.1 FAD-binding oxidoreductase [Zymomonas mobilis subsp. pomaceae]